VTAPHGPREALNGIKWKEGSLAGVVVTYIHRGAPGDIASFRGEDLIELGRSFIEVRSDAGTTMLPYHRVLEVRRGGETVWARRGRSGPTPQA
jgi:hypothetical protein